MAFSGGAPSLRQCRQTLRLVQWGVQRDYFRKTNNFLSEMSTQESLGAIPITLLFDCFCVYHLFSNCWKLYQKLRASLISPVLVARVFDERNIRRGLCGSSRHGVMILVENESSLLNIPICCRDQIALSTAQTAWIMSMSWISLNYYGHVSMCRYCWHSSFVNERVTRCLASATKSSSLRR